MSNGNDAKPGSRVAIISWAMYDWANSAYAAVITTFVFAAYFSNAVVGDPVAGTEMWGYAISISGLAVAVLGPILGAIADHIGRRKPWIFLFTAIMAASTSLLWYTKPDPAYVFWALTLVALSNLAFEMGNVFYNAMLPSLAGRKRIGRVSGWSWGFGYAGGLVCLGLIFVGFVNADAPWFGLDKETAEHVRVTGPFVGVWVAVFSVPLFLYTPDRPATGLSMLAAMRQGLATLGQTLRKIRDYTDVVNFLIANMIYRDGLVTLFAFGGIYAAGTFGMDFSDLVIFGIGMNVTAGLGATAFAWIDDWAGPKRTVVISLISMAVLGSVIIFVDSKAAFLVFTLALGVFVGPTQAASRSMMAHLAPAAIRTEMFGFYALSGKATAFVGPAILAWVTATADSQRAGMATIIAFFLVGLILLLRVPEVRR